MSEVTVRALGGEDWQTYRQLRLRALQEDPQAFVSSFDQEKEYEEALWRLRMARSVRLVAALDEEPVGVVSIGQADDDAAVAELFGLWVAEPQRGAGVAMRLTQAAAEHVQADGRRAVKLWVVTDNGRAVAFFSSAGFRPTDERRPVTGAPATEELAMVLPVGQDRGHPFSPA
ncbi:MAG: GNAT family N-acetyltransferase [Angustibacter sp.]